MLEERVNITRMDFRPWASVRGGEPCCGALSALRLHPWVARRG